MEREHSQGPAGGLCSPLLAGALRWCKYRGMEGLRLEKSPSSLKARLAASLSCAGEELGAALGLCSYVNAAKWGLS